MMLDNLNGRGLVLTMDEVARTAHVDAVYPLAVPTCAAQGTTMDTATGNVVVGCIEDGVREYDLASGAMIWEALGTCRNGRDARAIRWYPLEDWELRLD
jgi:hypothetical protein